MPAGICSYLVVFDPEDGAAPTEISPVIHAPLEDDVDQIAIPHGLAATGPGAARAVYGLHLPQSRGGPGRP
ncbi:hypothetical protein LV779_02675 [Streptomyces thinghirensis]|nr:hypothetical protein [Streptomyces thinghirensis]